MMQPFRIGLTGSIGMGKSTTTAMFADEGVPVWDADAAVHRLYSPGGAAVAEVEKAFPAAVVAGSVDRAALRGSIADDPDALSRLEGIVHPLVALDRAGFLARAGAAGAPIVVLDIPLLYETGAEDAVDAVVVVSAPEDVQRARVLARPDMTEDALERILARQVPDAEKRARADHVIETTGLDTTRAQVRKILDEIRARQEHRDA